MRKRLTNRHLPACVYLKHGSYWYVKGNKWHKLSSDLSEALKLYADAITGPKGGMVELLEEAYDVITLDKSDNTVKQYKLSIDRLKKIFKEFAPDQVTQSHIAQLKNSMASTPNQCNRMLSVLRLAFNHALEHGLIHTNPCTGVMRHKEHKRDVYFSDENFNLIVGKTQHNILRISMQIQYLTGQRISDVLKIKLEDVLEQGLLFEQQKTGKKLMVRMTPELRHLVDETKYWNGQTYLMESGAGRPFSYGTVKDAFNRAKRDHGITGVCLNDVRAKSLTDAKRQGLDATLLAGHKNKAMTDRYIRLRELDIATGPQLSRLKTPS